MVRPPDRPRPKRPEVLITTAATGEGVPELLAALDRHRAAGRVRSVSRCQADPCRGAGLGDRRRPPPRAARGDTGHAATTAAVLAEVAEHRLDPYAAADRLLESLGTKDG